MKAESVAEFVNKPAHLHFGCGVFRLYRAHCCASLRVNRLFGHSQQSWQFPAAFYDTFAAAESALPWLSLSA